MGTDRTALADMLLDRRTALGLTRPVVIERAASAVPGVSGLVALKHWESGTRRPALAQLFALGRVYGFGPKDFHKCCELAAQAATSSP